MHAMSMGDLTVKTNGWHKLQQDFNSYSGVRLFLVSQLTSLGEREHIHMYMYVLGIDRVSSSQIYCHG